MFAALTVKVSSSLDGKVVGFRGSAGENDFLGRGTNETGDLFAGLFRDVFGFPSKGVSAGVRVSEGANLGWGLVG